MRARVPGTQQWTSLYLVAIEDFEKVKVNLLRRFWAQPALVKTGLCSKRKP